MLFSFANRKSLVSIIAYRYLTSREWRKMSRHQNGEQQTQGEREMERAVENQLRELEKFEDENRTKHCGIDVWMILCEHGWIR